MSWLEEFAANRSKRLTGFEDEIRTIVEDGLREYSAGAWYADIVQGAAVLWLEIFESTSPEGVPDAPLATFQRELGESLALTTQPADPPTEGQIDRIARWVGVYAVNSAQYHGARAVGAIEKTWIDMEDSAVRATHRAVAGQTVQILGTFDVGGHKLHFPGEPVGDPAVYLNCRCLLATRTGDTMSATIGKVSFAVDTEVEERELTDEDIENEDLVDDVTEVPWHGVLVVEGVETGDRRLFEMESITYGTFPLPLFFQRQSSDGHGGSVTIGRIDRIERTDDGQHRGYGMLNTNVPEANEFIDGITFGSMGGVSVDVDSMEFNLEFDEEDEDADPLGMLFGGGKPPLMRATAGRLRGATGVGIPAFQEAFIALGPSFDEELRDPSQGGEGSDLGEGELALLTPEGEKYLYIDDDGSYVLEELAFTDEEEAAFAALFSVKDVEDLEGAYALVASAFAPGTQDGPGWLTNPRETQRLRSYWTKGKGAAKIRWGTPGDFNRCRRQLAKYVNPAFLAGTCANLHKEATGAWPGVQRGDKHAGTPAPAFAIVASAGKLEPLPGEMFQNPQLTAPTPLTVTDDGHVFGHVAAFGTCHIGLDQRCVTPPHSTKDYSYFAKGYIDTTLGDIPVGQIVMGTGHANGRLNASRATAHYDHTGYAAADIAVGEDEFGIWFSGMLREGVTPQQVRELRATGAVSGDWRDVGSGQPEELVGVVAVNVEGFQLPRLSFAVDGDRQLSLVASGVLTQEMRSEPITASGGFLTEQDIPSIARVFADEVEYRAERKLRIAGARDPELMELATNRRAERIAAARTLEE